MSYRSSPFLMALLVCTIVLAACGEYSPVASAIPGTARLDVSTESETGPCPPTLPPGYVLHTCFNFTPIDGVWHGFVLERSVAQPPEGQGGQFSRTRLNWDYVLITPTGYRRLEAGGAVAPPSAAADLTAFQAETNGREWIDVFRIIRGVGTRSGPMTIAIAKRSRTVRTMSTDLLRAVAALRAEGRLTAPQATTLARHLRLAIEYQDSGRSSDARTSLESFILQVQAASGLTSAQSEALVVGARDVIARLTP